MAEVKMAYLTVCRDMGRRIKPGISALADNMRFAQKYGYPHLEVAAFPRQLEGEATARDFYGETVNADWVLENPKHVREDLRRLKEETGVGLTALCYCANTIGNKADRLQVAKVIKSAKPMDVRNVVMFIGNLHYEIAEIEKSRGPMNGEAREAYFRQKLEERIGPLESMAADMGIVLNGEPCPMRNAMGFSAYGSTSNWFSGPREWEIVFDVLPKFRMWYDPSHTRNYRPQIDGDPSAEATIHRVIKDFGRMFGYGCHLKDGEDDKRGMAENLSLGSLFSDNVHTGGLWVARAPGKGQISWADFERNMRHYAPQCQVRSVEMEDPDVQGKEANEKALVEVAQYYKPLLEAVL
jgi:sugar phosphate isomerase/epimerase